MQSHAATAIDRADVLVLVRDATDPREPISLSRLPDLTVRSKIDLLSEVQHSDLAISAHTSAGMSDLREALDRVCFGHSAAAESLALTGRHVAAIGRAESQLAAGPELLALELHEALAATGQVLGHLTPDDLLGRIFSTFCIGK